MKNEDVKNFKKLSHEFKVPVTNLNLILETLYEYDKNLSTERKKEIIQLAIKEIDRLQDLINYFSNFNMLLKSINGNIKQVENINCLDDLTFISKNLCFQKNLFITFSTNDRNCSGLVNINLRTYKNVIFNLFGNANKFISYEGWIFLETDTLTSISISSFTYISYKRASVVDDGIGMNSNIQVFIKSNKFISYEHTQNIGLSIVKEMLSTHTIPLNVISYPGKGAKLFFNMKVIH
jgi:signal transduction histidine kinase